MRLFISVPVPDEIKNILVSVQSKLKYAKLIRVQKEALHLTQKFLGEVPQKKVEDITKRLSQVRFSAFMIRLDSLSAFSNKQRPNVVWVGLQPAEKIIQLQHHLEAALHSLFPQDELFHAHITIARVKFVEDKKEFKELLKNISVPPLEFEIKSFELVSSTLTPEGPVYKILKRFSSV